MYPQGTAHPVSNADQFNDVADTGLCLDQSVKHIREEGTLSDSRSRPSLAKVGVVHTKSFGKGWVDVIHKNASNIDGVFFEVVEGANSIQEGSIIDLRGEADLSAVDVNITLPNVIKHIMRLKRVAGNKHFKHFLMDGCKGQAANLTLQFTIDDRAISLAGGEVEDWLEEVVGSILVSRVEYLLVGQIVGPLCRPYEPRTERSF
jgi:hypothetical protein